MRTLAAASLISLATAMTAQAGGPVPSSTVTLTLKDHRFTPATMTVPANQKVQIVLVNQDRATEEFDSHDLRVERLVTPGATVRFTLGPLKPGSYGFVGEFHPETAQGRITAQ